MPTPYIIFSPSLAAENYISGAIAAATSTIRLQVYTFTARVILEALVAAKLRGVSVQACQDFLAYHESGDLGPAAVAAHIPWYLDHAHPIAHSKVIVIDNHLVLTGSYNFSNEATENLENLVVIDDPATAVLYLANWQQHYAHCTPAQA